MLIYNISTLAIVATLIVHPYYAYLVYLVLIHSFFRRWSASLL